MKFLLFFIFINIAYSLEEKTEELIRMIDCNHFYSEKCEKIRNKVKFTVEIESTQKNATHNDTKNSNDLFYVQTPISICKSEECEFCCLTTNKCGSKIQCENGKYSINIINGIFIGLIIIVFMCLIIKCFQVDSYPDQKLQDKIKEEDLKHLISIFSIVKLNRKKILT